MENVLLKVNVPNFFNKLAKENPKIILFIGFVYSDTCQYSKHQLTVLSTINNEKIKVMMINIKYLQNKDELIKFGIKMSPSLLIFDGNIKLIQGFVSISKLQKKINTLSKYCRNCKYAILELNEKNQYCYNCDFHHLPQVEELDNCEAIKTIKLIL